MKKLIIAAVLMIGMTSFAQEKKENPAERKREKMERMSPEERNAKQLKTLTSELNLTEAQQTEIGKILAEQPPVKVQEKRTLTQQEMDLMHNQQKNEMKAKEKRIKAILTPEQVAKHDELKAKKRQEIAQKRQERKEVKENK